jgi:NitT/TauT family transport system substrate-binding protein
MSAAHATLSRRRALRALALPVLGGLALPGCAPAGVAPLRIGAHPWVGYELMFLARERHYVDETVRLVEIPTASASLRALSAGTLEGAGLTLDEVLSARARGLALQVVAVIDVSNGADVLLGGPAIGSLAALRGRRIGVEQSATGALMLDAALGRAGLRAADVQLVPLAFNEHAQAFQGGRVDALVSAEPVRSLLLGQGARVLFSSAEVPGLIVDVLAVRAEAMAPQADALSALVAGLFRAQADWRRDPAAQAPLMSARLRLPPVALVRAFDGLDLPDLAANRQWLAGDTPTLAQCASRLVGVMQRAALLPADGAGATPEASAAAVDRALVEPRFLPAR